MILLASWYRKNNRYCAKNFALNQCLWSSPSVLPCRYTGSVGSCGMTSYASLRMAANRLAAFLFWYVAGFFSLSEATSFVRTWTWSRNKGCAKMLQPAMIRGDGFVEMIKPHHLVGGPLNQTAPCLPTIAGVQPRRYRVLVSARDGWSDHGIKNGGSGPILDRQT